MKRLLAFCVFSIASLAPAQQQTGPTALPSSPFSVRKTWQIGGEGAWDYLAVDPTAQQLFIAHGQSVQVVDIETGSLTGQIVARDSVAGLDSTGRRRGLGEAHGIALDDSGQYGYISAGITGIVEVFDRRLLKVVASVPTGPSPRAIVFEPRTRLVFVICAAPTEPPSQGSRPQTPAILPKSWITVIETEKWKRVGNIQVAGKLGFAQADGKGNIFVNVVDANEILSFDAQAVETLLLDPPKDEPPAEAPPNPTTAQKATASTRPPSAAATTSEKEEAAETINRPSLEWPGSNRQSRSSNGTPVYFPLSGGCQQPTGLAIDSTHERLFVACGNLKLAVLNSASGALVASLDIGLGSDVVGYDPNRGLIYAANGGGLGSLSIIRQDVTDTYAVVQDLPTQPRTRTLAVNPVSGDVYLVAAMSGFDLSRKGKVMVPGTLPVVQETPVSGSFQVLVVGR
jgi:DNA-binding beta-propeller fold protein YncE